MNPNNRTADEVILKEELPTAGEYNALRAKVGWAEPPPEAVAPGLRGSAFCVCARAGGTLVGMARIIGDGGLVYYIQDVIVVPAWQGRGIGRRLMDRTMDFIRGRAVRHTIVGLMAAKGRESFYEPYGFRTRPNESMGPGMTMFWGAE
jgi:GNAT superfamily N-acetyltransferase